MGACSKGIVICGCPPAVGTQWSGCDDAPACEPVSAYMGYGSPVQGPTDFGSGFLEYWIQIQFSGITVSEVDCSAGFVVNAGGQQVPDGRFFVYVDTSASGTLSWDQAYGSTLDSWTWDGQGSCLVDTEGCPLAAFQGGGATPG